MVGLVPLEEEIPGVSLCLSRGEKAAGCKPGRGPSPGPALGTLCQISSLQSYENVNFHCLSYPVYGILLCSPS